MATTPTAGPTKPPRERLDRTARITVGVLFLAWLIDYLEPWPRPERA